MSVTAKLRRRLGEEQGQALVLAMVIIFVGMLLGIAAVTFALSNTQQTGHDAQTRSSQQSASAGVQQQLLNQSDSDAVGYNLTGGPLGLSTLLDCTVPQIASSNQINDIQVAANSAGVCPTAVTSACTSGAQAATAQCPVQSAPWTADSNGAYFESELFPNATFQPTSSATGGPYAVEFPAVVSVGCQTSSLTPISSCDNGDKTNAYSRKLALLQPTAPLQALEGENNVTVNTTLGAGINGLSIIDGNIVAGNNLQLPSVAATFNLSGSNVLSWLVGGLTGSLTGQTTIGSSPLSTNINAALSFGNQCFAGSSPCQTGNPSTSPVGADVASATGGSSNACMAGKPSTNCWLQRSGFSLVNPSGVSCLSTPGTPGISGISGTGVTCAKGVLASSGSVSLSPGTYVFCAVDVQGSIANASSGGAVQVYVAGPGEDGCPNSLQATVSASPASSGSSTYNFAATASGGSGSGYTYSWSFGDSSPGSGQSVSHTYSGAGTYTATLTVGDSAGATVTYTIVINITTVPLSVSLGSCPPSTSNGSWSCTPSVSGGTSSYSSYSWNFGDGGTSTTAGAITHSFVGPGKYTVSLTVTDSSGATATATATVSVTGALVIANPVCTVNLAATGVACAEATPSSGFSPFSYSWNFGDGATATGASPSHSYAYNGGYTISVTVTDASGQTSTTRTNVTINSSSLLLTAGITASVTPTPPYISSTGSSVQPTVSGSFTLKVLGISLTNTPCGSAGVTCSYSWTVGGPSGGATLIGPATASPKITFSQAGVYYATVLLTGMYGGTTLGQADVVTTIVVIGSVQTALTASGSIASTVSNTVSFMGSATGGSGTDSYRWNFGDSSTASTSQNPSHTYSSAGDYPVMLTVADAAGDTSTYSVTAVVGSAASASGAGVTVNQTGSSASGAPAGSFIATAGINNLVSDLINGEPAASPSVDPSAFQVYVQGNPTADSWQQGGQGSPKTPSTTVTIGNSGTLAEQAAVVYAPLSTVNVSSGTLFEGSLVGWNVNITAPIVLEDLDLGNYPLSSAVNAHQIVQNIECSNSVTKLTAGTSDLSGC